MQLLSAAEAVSPAMNRTRDFLFRPFEWGTFLKLSAAAVITEGLCGNFNFSGNRGSSTHMDGRSVPFNIPPGTITALIAIGIVALALGVVLLYLIVRLRFALFHCLIHRIRELTPGWRLYREQAFRFFLLTIVVALGFVAAALVALTPFVSGFIKVFHESQVTHRLDLSAAIPLALQLIPVMLLLGLAGVALDVVMRDFMLPHMALENASAGEAWSAVLERIGDQKGAFVLYALLRVLLPMVAMMGIFIVLAIPMVILFGIPGVMMAGIQATLGHATGAAWLAGTLLQIVLGLFMVALGVFIAIVVGGPLSVAIRNYALLFYGGRYAALGNVLAPPAASEPVGVRPLPA